MTITKERLYQIVADVEDEWQVGGLSGEGNMYADLAVIVAQRAIREAVEEATKWQPIGTAPLGEFVLVHYENGGDCIARKLESGGWILDSGPIFHDDPDGWKALSTSSPQSATRSESVE